MTMVWIFTFHFWVISSKNSQYVINHKSWKLIKSYFHNAVSKFLNGRFHYWNSRILEFSFSGITHVQNMCFENTGSASCSFLKPAYFGIFLMLSCRNLSQMKIQNNNELNKNKKNQKKTNNDQELWKIRKNNLK